ncbi:acyl-CoA dehydrogenase family protein [Sagittula stellata]|uniref:3-sulfinopropanoyl-CoA desulfinase n=1 Tax=Sagittula stellata (strain ATCC 700073 / DSM 11524 / E-37) TaxID=388399 RepID=A3K7Y8_SAGS3|nr:acyl-CoA dehydrogenase family protein [Sagittula stellata]EBA06760.1 putative acyl-CoA dehydrogenase [Sagittula stellata E-37]
MFTEEQKSFRDMLRKVTEKEVAPIASRIDETDEFPYELAELFGELGLLSLWVPEEYGGAGGDLTTVCIAKEELGRASLTASALAANNSIGLILPVLHMGTEEQKQKYLPISASGKVITAIGMTEPGTGSDVRSMKTFAKRQGNDSYVINGQKSWITWGGVADYVLVFAKTSEGTSSDSISAFLVDTKTPGFRVGRKERKMGRNGAPNHELFFEDMVVPADCMLGEEGTGFKGCMKILDLNRPTVAGSSLGLAQGALDTALAFAKERVQFGRAVSQFQGMQFKFADMHMKTEAARALLYSVCAEIDSGDHSRLAMLGAVSKCYVTDVAMEVTTEAVQAMGSAGYSKEYPVERMMRDAKLNQILEGTNEIQRMIIGRNLAAA